MKTYRLVMMTRLTGIPWEYEFTQPSDKMAIEAAQQMLSPDHWPESCTSILLFEMEKKGMVAAFSLKPSVLEVRRSGSVA
jgi:hypothetical protein